ncbi:MAG: ABC transporter ATP-binding protein [Bacilli bacterium]|nr:ABC transporter ATP-binding protein [Bacilli bacterium]
MSTFLKLMKWVRSYWFLVLIIALLTIFTPITYSYVPQFIKYLMDFILNSSTPIIEGDINLPSFLLDIFSNFSGFTAIWILGLALIIYLIFRGVIIFFNGYFKGVYSENIAKDVRTSLFAHIQDLPYSYHNKLDTGDLIQRCTSDVETIRGFLSVQMPELLFVIASLSAGVYQMALIDVRIMLVTLVTVPINFVTSVIYFRYIYKEFTISEENEAKMISVLQENVNGVRVVKAFAREPYAINRFEEESRKFTQSSEKINNAMATFWGFSDFITIGQYALTVIVSVYFAKAGIISIGDIIACLMYVGMLVYPIKRLGRIIGDFSKTIVATKRVEEILGEPTEYANDGKLTPVVTGDISFENVSFKFDDTKEHLLNNVNFEIKSGETIAIVGKTGAGKSTIVNILVRMYDYFGSIKLDGVELREIKKKWVRENVGIILQDPFIYGKTVMENIRIGNPALDNKAVFNAAQIASLHNDVVNFTEGYNTLVGEKGVTLSGGQKQRLAIARMLVLNKPIMIFDDSLSAVDTRTDLNIRNALKMREKQLTSIIITHRITTALQADKIMVLEDGRITNIGTHEELVKKEGLYKTLWSIQGSLEDEFKDLVSKEVE